jgi:hypothetical protein
MYTLIINFSNLILMRCKISEYPTCAANSDTDNHRDGKPTGSLAKVYDPRFLYHTSLDKDTFFNLSNTT